MRTLGKLTVLFLILLIIISCNEKIFTFNVNCDECYYPEPENADLVVYVTINDRYREVPLVFYDGEIEDEEAVIARDTAYASPFYLWVQTNKEYSVKAEYKKSHASLFVVDGTRIKTSHVQEACDEGECYIIENETLDVRIKDEFSDF